jgi:hypothetical protein
MIVEQSPDCHLGSQSHKAVARSHRPPRTEAPMTYALPAQAAAQFISLIVFAFAARWYAAPWLKAQPRAQALTALLWVQVVRYVALQVFAAQHEGFPISMGGAMEIVVGDVAGAGIAFLAIAALRAGSQLGIWLSWLLALETAYDTYANIRGGVREHLMGAATGVTWMVLAFFVPMVVVSCVLIVWQLISRRNEALASPGDSVAPGGAAPMIAPGLSSSRRA